MGHVQQIIFLMNLILLFYQKYLKKLTYSNVIFQYFQRGEKAGNI